MRAVAAVRGVFSCVYRVFRLFDLRRNHRRKVPRGEFARSQNPGGSRFTGNRLPSFGRVLASRRLDQTSRSVLNTRAFGELTFARRLRSRISFFFFCFRRTLFLTSYFGGRIYIVLLFFFFFYLFVSFVDGIPDSRKKKNVRLRPEFSSSEKSILFRIEARNLLR